MSLYSDSADFERVPTVTPDGVINDDSEFTEFYADGKSLKELILNTWYTEQSN